MRKLNKTVLIGCILAGTLSTVHAADKLAGTFPDADILSGLGHAISEQELGGVAGGEELAFTIGDVAVQGNQVDQTANTSSNLLQGLVNTGTNHVSDNAFQNATGIATLIQNTGNQVIIQNSMNFNVLLK